MKIIIFIFTTFMATVFALPVFAVNGKMDQPSPNSSPQVSQVQNTNQVETQNQGKNNQLQVNTQEQENLDENRGEGLETRNQNAVQNMSVVAQKVQALLQIKTNDGIGEQVRQIARDQNQAQTQIQTQITKLDSKNQFAKFILGTDFGAVKNLKTQLEQNRLRIAQLEQLKNQLNDDDDLNTIQETIQALIQQNTSLQQRISAEEQTKSLFGWLFKLLT